MAELVGLGRVAVLDGGESGRRVLRAVRELRRLGRAEAAVAIQGARERTAAVAREADETIEVAGPPGEALGRARADTAWLGRGSLAARAELAERCARLGVRL